MGLLLLLLVLALAVYKLVTPVLPRLYPKLPDRDLVAPAELGLAAGPVGALPALPEEGRAPLAASPVALFLQRKETTRCN